MSEHLIGPLPEEGGCSKRCAWSASFFGTLSVLMILDWAHSNVPVVPYNGWWTIAILTMTGVSLLGMLFANAEPEGS